MINLGSNPRPMPWPADGCRGDPDPVRRAEELAHQYADLRMAA